MAADLREVQAASPHTRGWTREGRVARREPLGFPAHAGMDPFLLTR